jgi:hypothetical protein
MPVGKKSPRWRGELAKPIRPWVDRPRGLAVTDAKTVARANREMERLKQLAYEKALVEKLGLLMGHYGIREGDFYGLALKLAIDHVPGFQLDPTPLVLTHGDCGAVVYQGKKVGRRKEWTEQRLDHLLVAVEITKSKHGFFDGS